MKRTILMVMGIAVLAAGAYAATLFAQGTTPAQPAAQQGTKIGVVNVGYVFNNWNRAKRFKTELEQAADPFNKQAKALQDQMAQWDAEAHKPSVTKAQVEQYAENIKGNKRKLEDLAGDMRKLLGKKSEDNLVSLWKEANECVEGVAKAYGFSIVMGYGDPLEAGLMNQFPNVNRKMGAMDAGSAVPLYVHGSSDLSDAVTKTLNHWDKLRQDAAGAPSVPGVQTGLKK